MVIDEAKRIAGVVVLRLEMHRDERGHLTEIFRDEFVPGLAPRQWHILATRAGGLRGMHVHARHGDYKVLLQGRAVLVLKDLRRGSPSEGAAEVRELSAEAVSAVFIPAGVAHGLLARKWSIVAVAATQPYDPADEFGFRWDDPELGVEWPAEPTILSERDRNAQSLRQLLAELEPHQPI